MGVLDRAKAWGNNTKKGSSNAWVGGDRSSGVGMRDWTFGGPVHTGVKALTYGSNKNGKKDGYGPDGAPAYETPPGYQTEAGTTAQAARMNDNSGAWQRLAEQKQLNEEGMQMDKQARLANSGAASARAGLAMRGGLRGGAGERIAAQANEAALMANQMTLGQGVGDRLGIGMKAQDMSRDTDKTNATFTQQANIANAGNMMNREQGRNTNMFQMYNEKMKQKGADYAARQQAIASSRPTLLSDPLGYVRQYV